MKDTIAILAGTVLGFGMALGFVVALPVHVVRALMTGDDGDDGGYDVTTCDREGEWKRF